MTDLGSDIKFVKGVGPKKAAMFEKLGVRTLYDLLYLFPRRYEDWNDTESIADAPCDENVCVKAVVCYDARESLVSGGRTIVKTAVTDGLCGLEVVFFNNRFVADKLKEGRELLFYGRITRDGYGSRQMLSPQIAVPGEVTGLVPVYPLTAGLTSRAVAKTVRQVLDAAKPCLGETLPAYIIEKYKLPPLYSSLEKMHFPQNEDEARVARRRLIFEELLVLELSLMLIRSREGKETSCVMAEDHTPEFISSLPFVLTGAQKRAIAEGVADMRSGRAMDRLLQGDVGSGKTAVAAALIYNAVRNGYQAALMAPTEVLANQHFGTFRNFYGSAGIETVLLTGSTPAKEKKIIKEKLASGEADLVIGTHALIQKDVAMKNPGLVITDEQHRFGVRQRDELNAKGDRPHTLVMSATPIPRTLAMMIYGDLNVSVLDELPPGRMPVDTLKVETDYRGRVFNFIKKQIENGRQCYIICPLVEEGSNDVAPAVEYCEELRRGAFAGYEVGLLHGRMKPKEKDAVMQSFSDGTTQILVSTVVVEVGVDVPNATVMVIENAERFGLSQLHQLRGRIGRGKHKSYCILISDAQNAEAKDRLDALCRTNSGFEIAEYDLSKRGPGDFFGSRQHGLPEMKLADFMTDAAAVTATQKIAAEILALDPALSDEENKLLKNAVAKKI